MLSKNITYFTLATLVFFACTKKVEKKGCMDPLASNYSTLAQIDDGTCTYDLREQVIWRNGVTGAWDDNFLEGGIAILPCIGSYSVDTIGTDTSGAPRRAIVIRKDSANRFGLVGRLVNQQDARDYVNGYLRFDAMLPSGSGLAVLDVHIQGGDCFGFGQCSNLCRSGAQQIVTYYLSDTAFTEVAMPLLDFPNRKLALVDNLFMFTKEVPTGSDEVLILDNIRWTSL